MTGLRESEGSVVRKKVFWAGRVTRYVTRLDVSMIRFPFRRWIGITDERNSNETRFVCSLYFR